MDHRSFLLLKEKIINTDELIGKCQFLQNQLDVFQKDQSKQQMELKLMENETALLLSAKRKCESELQHKLGVLKAYENSIKQYTAKISEFEKVHDRDVATIKTLQAQRDTAISENRRVSSYRNRSAKARTKHTQTELLVQMDDNSRIIVANFPSNHRQRRRNSQAASRVTISETRELNCITPTIVLPPTEKTSTPKSSCSEVDNSSDGEDISEKDMTWLAQITEQPVVTPLCDAIHNYSDSELDDSNDNLLLPYSTMDMSISPLPPTPSMNVDNTNDVSIQSDQCMDDVGLLNECHLSSSSPAMPRDDHQRIEESTLISSYQLSDDPDNVVVTTDSAGLLLEKATDLQVSPFPRILGESSHKSSDVLVDDKEICKSPILQDSPDVKSSNMVAFNSPKLSSPDCPSSVPVFVSDAPNGLTSPTAVRSVSNGSGIEFEEHQISSNCADLNLDSVNNTTFNKDSTSAKCHKFKITNLGGKQSGLYFPSIAERTRSQSSRCGYDTAFVNVPKVTKQAKRQLSKLAIKMNTFKPYQSDSASSSITKDHQYLQGQKDQRNLPGAAKNNKKRKKRKPQRHVRLAKRLCQHSFHHSGEEMKCGYANVHDVLKQPRLVVDRASSIDIGIGEGEENKSESELTESWESLEINYKDGVANDGLEKYGNGRKDEELKKDRERLNRFDNDKDEELLIDAVERSKDELDGDIAAERIPKTDVCKHDKSDGELDSEDDQDNNVSSSVELSVCKPDPFSDAASAPFSQNTETNAASSLPAMRHKNNPHSKLSLSVTDLDDSDPPCDLLKEANIPGWLEWALSEEEKTPNDNLLQHSFVKGQIRRKTKNRLIPRCLQQKAMDYLLVNLERLLLGTLKLEIVINMFSDPRNIDSTSEFANALAKFIVEAFHPPFESVALKLAERCNKAVCHNAKIFPHYKPLDENFHPVMLRFESQIVAMIIAIEMHNPDLDNLIGCVADTLRHALFVSLEDNKVDVHKQCSLIRLMAGLSRAVGKVDYMQRLCLDLISFRRPLSVSQLPMLQAVVGVWPLVLARQTDVKLYRMKEVIPEGLEPQIVSHTVEVTTCYLIGKQDTQEFSHLLFKTFVSFCRWQQLSSEAAMHLLATALVKILTTSPNITLSAYDRTSEGKWFSPQLSTTAHMCITCLAVVGKYLGWKWISDSLIREMLWPLLQKWSRKAMGEEVSEAVITAITQLIGLVGKQGILHDSTCQSVRQLQKMLSSLLQRAHNSSEVTLSIQLAVAESLISLCYPSQSSVATEVLQNWLAGVKTHHPYAAQTIWEDFTPRVWNMQTLTNKPKASDEKTY